MSVPGTAADDKVPPQKAWKVPLITFTLQSSWSPNLICEGKKHRAYGFWGIPADQPPLPGLLTLGSPLLCAISSGAPLLRPLAQAVPSPALYSGVFPPWLTWVMLPQALQPLGWVHTDIVLRVDDLSIQDRGGSTSATGGEGQEI